MKKLLLAPILLLAIIAFGQTGYEIKVTLKPFKSGYLYLGHYPGKQYPIVDSPNLNEKSEAVFKGNKKLGGGIYLVVYPAKNNFFEVLIDKQQHFSVVADTLNIRQHKQFTNSPDNVLFDAYQSYMVARGRSMDSAKRFLAASTTAKDSAHWRNQLRINDSLVTD